MACAATAPADPPRRRPHGGKTSEAEGLSRGEARLRRRAKSAPLTALRLRKKDVSMRSTALSAEVARAPAPRRRGGRLSRWRMRRRACPEAPRGNRRRQFLSDNQSSRYVESRARSAAYRRAVRRGRDDAKIGENAIPARLTDNPLISLETAKEKVWKSLEKFGISLEFPWNFLGKVWKSLKKLGVTATRYSTPHRPASAGEQNPRRAARRRKIVTQALENRPSRRKTAPAPVGSAVASAATRCATLRADRHDANHAAPASARANGRSPPLSAVPSHRQR